jgi:hypothetical protein
MSRKTLKNKKVATGNVAIQTPEDSVYSLVGFKTFPYKQKDQVEYKAFLNEMNLADLQRHAVSVGIIPTAVSRTILEDRLEREYLKKKYAYVDVKDVNPVTARLNKEDEADIADLLARGR